QMVTVLQATTAAIPVVSIAVNPVGTGLAISLARPGGNVTGFSIDTGLEIYSKRLELLKQAFPAASRTGILFQRRVIELPPFSFRKAAELTGLTLIDVGIEPPIDDAAYRRAFAIMARERVDSLLVSVSLEDLSHRHLIAELAAEAKLPG